MADQTPTLADIILAAMDTRLRTVFTAIPGVIQSFDRKTQIAAVLPGIHDVYTDESGDVVSEPMPVLPNVPVVFLGSGQWRATFPVTKGDRCLLVVSSVSIGEWLVNRADTTDPVTRERNHISNAIALVGLRDAKQRLHETPGDHMSLGSDDGATVEVYPDEVRVGGEDATGDIVVQSALDDFMGAINAAMEAAADPSTASPTTIEVLGYLKAALMALGGGAGWKAGTFVAKAK